MILREKIFRHLPKLLKKDQHRLFISHFFLILQLILINIGNIQIISLHSFLFPIIQPKYQINPII